MSIWFRSGWINPFRASSYNWIDFTLAEVSFEPDRQLGRFEFRVALPGLHVGGSLKAGSGNVQLQASLEKAMEEIDSGLARVSIQLSEYKALREKAGESVE